MEKVDFKVTPIGRLEVSATGEHLLDVAGEDFLNEAGEDFVDVEGEVLLGILDDVNETGDWFWATGGDVLPVDILGIRTSSKDETYLLNFLNEVFKSINK